MNLILSYSEFIKPLTALMREGKNSTYYYLEGSCYHDFDVILPCRWERHIRVTLDGTLSFHFQIT